MKTIVFDFYNTIYNPKRKRLFWGAFSLLKTLKKQSKLILITSGEKNRWQELTDLKLISLFNQIILCKQKDISVFRPYTDPASLVIGDRQEAEISIGNQLQAKTILVNPSKENPVISIKKFFKLYGKI